MTFSWLSFWEVVEGGGTVLVIVGCVGEYFVEFKKLPSDDAKRDRFAKGWLLLLIGGLVIELLASSISKHISGLEIAELNSEAGKARQAAGEAIERANKADLARVELEKQVAPRRLTGNQRTSLVKLLSDDPGAIVVVSTMMDGESSDFADDLDAVFREAKWQTSRVKNFGQNWHGVSVGTFKGTQLGDTKRVHAALVEIGVPNEEKTFDIEDEKRMSPWFESGFLYLVIAHKLSVSFDGSSQK